jgi:N-acetyl-gamma-glutamyl-phosphate reductase
MHTTEDTRASSHHRVVGVAGSAGTAAPVTRVAVAGVTGYAGQELLRLLARHPAVTVTAAMSSGAAGPTGPNASTLSSRRLPALTRVWDGSVVPLDRDTLARDADVVFLALPDSAAAKLAPELVDAGIRVIDLSGAFRLRNAGARARWYPETDRVPDGVVYGLTERERHAVSGARMVANPGCYPTVTLLALAPLAAAGLLVPGADIIVDAKSGVSGAGKTPSERTHFSECHGSISAYGVFDHRHGAEIEEGMAIAAETAAYGPVNFVPHLVPLDRGILATSYVRMTSGTTEETLASVYQQAYVDAPFVRLVGASLPAIKQVAHSNFCDIGWRVDGSGRAVVVSVIDNLVKGAAGQAVQNLNVMLGIDERTGLL